MERNKTIVRTSLLGISVNTFNRHRQNGLPYREAGKYDVRQVCEWVLKQPKRGKMWEHAMAWLSANGEQHDEKPKLKKSAPRKPEPKSPKKDKPQEDKPEELKHAERPAKIDDGLLFSPILDKFREAVDYLADSFNEAVKKGDFQMAAVIMKSWGPAFDNLRKAEESVLELGKQRGTMLPKEDVQAAFVAMAANLRNRLMVLPGKLSHELLNQSSSNKIMEVLDAEIRECLDAIGRNPFGVD